MKTFSRTAGAALLTILALQGCSTNPKVTGGASIQDFARNLNGTVYLLEQEGRVWVPTTSGELVTDQRIPKGLFIALTPAQEHCAAAGGQAKFIELQEAAAYQAAQLPRRIVCSQQGTTLWVLNVSYGDVRLVTGEGVPGGRPLTYLRLQTGTQLLSAEQYIAELQEKQAKERAQAEARDKAAAAQRERQAAFERERPQRIAEAQRLAERRLARVGAFQANLKAGDRVQWVRPSSMGRPEGMVVRVEGPVVFVQLDRPELSGQQAVYVPKSELEPIN